MIKISFWNKNVIILFSIYIFLEISLKSENFVVNQYIFDEFLELHNITKADNDQCINNSILVISDYYLAQSENSILNGRRNFYKGIIGFISVLLFGLYSDSKLGKKKTLIISYLGISLSALLNLVLINLKYPLQNFIYPSIIQGIFSGGEVGIIGFIIAAFSDLTEEKENGLINGSYIKNGYRVLMISIFGGLCPLISSIVSPMCAYFLSVYTYFSVLFFMYLFLLPSIFLIFKLNLIKSKRTSSCSNSVVVNNLSSGSLIYSLLSNRMLILLQISLFVINFVDNGVGSFSMTFLRSIPFCWTTQNYGNMDGLASGLIGSLSVSLNVFILLKLNSNKVKFNALQKAEEKVSLIHAQDENNLDEDDQEVESLPCKKSHSPLISNTKGLSLVLLSGVFRFISLVGFSQSLKLQKPFCDWLVVFAMMIDSFSYCTEYLLRAFTSNIIPNSHHGFLFSVYSAFQLLNSIAGNVVFSYIYSYTVLINPGTAFSIAALVYFTIFPMIGMTLWKVNNKSQE